MYCTLLYHVRKPYWFLSGDGFCPVHEVHCVGSDNLYYCINVTISTQIDYLKPGNDIMIKYEEQKFIYNDFLSY